jgi:hypothetical protein
MIKFDKGILEIEKLAKKVEHDPKDIQAKKELEVQLRKIEDKQISKPSTLRIVEKAYTAVGDSQKANIYRDRLLSIRKDNIK